MRRQIRQYAARVGVDARLIQGAGGNLSWKEVDSLWIKASGTWLANALEREVFVEVSLSEARVCARNGGDSYAECVKSGLDLRPSIETALHVLLPQRVVFHCHAVDVVARSVRVGGRLDLLERLDGLPWVWVEYAKPGPRLAAAVRSKVEGAIGSIPSILVLANHGLVVAGDSLDEADAFLMEVMRRTALASRPVSGLHDSSPLEARWLRHGYRLPIDCAVHSLATDPISIELVRKRWVLYPDHAVFLGTTAAVCEAGVVPEEFLERHASHPVCVIVPGEGVLVSSACSKGQEAMLECYAAVTRCLPSSKEVVGLSRDQVSELIDWEAENYRRNMSFR